MLYFVTRNCFTVATGHPQDGDTVIYTVPTFIGDAPDGKVIEWLDCVEIDGELHPHLYLDLAVNSENVYTSGFGFAGVSQGVLLHNREYIVKVQAVEHPNRPVICQRWEYDNARRKWFYSVNSAPELQPISGITWEHLGLGMWQQKIV